MVETSDTVECRPGAIARAASARPSAAGTTWTPWAYVPYVVALTTAMVLLGYSAARLVGLGEADAAGRSWWGGVVAVVTLVVGARWCFFFVLALVAHRRGRRAAAAAPSVWPPVTILVPAFNERETIAPALESLLALDYPELEVIVVDDGSADETFARALPFEGEHETGADGGGRCTVRVYRKPNGGKWSALNFAFARASHELILCVDADSRLDPGAVRALVVHMADPRVSVVAGQVRVRNRTNLVTRLQGLEYVMANGLIRLAQSFSGMVLVVPGPIGLFRREVLEEVYIHYGADQACDGPGDVAGPFEGDTFAEDFDLSVAVLSLGGRAVYEPAAVSHTKAPDSGFRLLNQRYRWGRGTLQVLAKYVRRAWVRPALRRPRLVAWLALTYGLELMVLPLVQVGALAVLVSSAAAGGDGAAGMAVWFGAFMLLNLNASAFFVALHEDRIGTLAALPFYDLYHAFFLNSGWAVAVIDEVRGRRMRW